MDLGGSSPARGEWARALTTAGWLCLLGYLSILAVNIDRARTISRSQFSDGIWGQRIEIISFTAIPQHLVVLALAAAAAVMATVMVGGDRPRDLWLDRLVRAVAGTALVAIGLAVIGVAWATVRGSQSVGDFNFVVSRLGGLALGAAVVRVCLVVERRDQTPSSPSR